MLLQIVIAGFAITGASFAFMLFARVKMLSSPRGASPATLPDADRYRPMLRLLSEEDIRLPGLRPVALKRLRERRRDLFRGYLRCLTKDYVRILAEVRRIMVESGVDRPDLAKALARNRMQFALALCRIEIRLRMHALGIGNVDVSGLVEALEAMRGAVGTLTAVPNAA